MLKTKLKSRFSEFFSSVPMLARLVELPQLESTQVARAHETPRIVSKGREYQELVALELSGELFQERVLHLVQSIALEAAEYGAKELFIGHPQEYRYEFFVESSGYQGSITPADYRALLTLFGAESELEFAVDHFEVEALFLSLTSNHFNPVVHVGWRMRWFDAEPKVAAFAQ